MNAMDLAVFVIIKAVKNKILVCQKFITIKTLFIKVIS